MPNNKLTFVCTDKYAKSGLHILNKIKCFLHPVERQWS